MNVVNVVNVFSSIRARPGSNRLSRSIPTAIRPSFEGAKMSDLKRPENKKEQKGYGVRALDWEETAEILLPKYHAKDHWILVAHLSAAPLITAIEQKYYLG